jgi:hypothetical protein
MLLRKFACYIFVAILLISCSSPATTVAPRPTQLSTLTLIPVQQTTTLINTASPSATRTLVPGSTNTVNPIPTITLTKTHTQTPAVTPTSTPITVHFNGVSTSLENPGEWSFIDPRITNRPGLIIHDGASYHLRTDWEVGEIIYLYQWGGIGQTIVDYQTVRWENNVYKIAGRLSLLAS